MLSHRDGACLLQELALCTLKNICMGFFLSSKIIPGSQIIVILFLTFGNKHV